MIQVTVLKHAEKSGDVVTGIELSGHAEYGGSGQDIVCAAVSALVLNMANSVEAFTKDEFQGEMEEESGSFRFHFTSDISPQSKLLMDSLILGIENIENQYGKSHITMECKEV